MTDTSETVFFLAYSGRKQTTQNLPEKQLGEMSAEEDGVQGASEAETPEQPYRL